MSGLDEIIEKLLPYPDYNMGLLPDEAGYSSTDSLEYYNVDAQRDEYKAEIKQLILELVGADEKPFKSTDMESQIHNIYKTNRNVFREELRKEIEKL